MEEESIFKLPTVIGYLVKLLRNKYPAKQIGKTVIQKQMFLYARQMEIDLNYSMYHYGPYSSSVSSELNYAEQSGLLTYVWKPDQGYFIDPTEELNKYLDLISETEKIIIAKIVDVYGNFTANELAVIATAFFIKDNYEVSESELASSVHDVKPNISLNTIKDLLTKVQVN